jgi:hypothetical protein
MTHENLEKIKLHVSKTHQQKPVWHKKDSLWRACHLQRFFGENPLVWYFVLTLEGPEEDSPADSKAELCLGHEEKKFFQQQGEDVIRVEGDRRAAADIVQGFGSHRSAVLPWFQPSGI